MANYGRGWGDGYGAQSKDAQEQYDDEVAAQEGDWDWLDISPRQQRLRQEQGLPDGVYAKEDLK